MHYAILFLLFLILQNNNINGFRCGADLIKKKPKILDANNTKIKRGLSTEYTPLKIKYDFTYLIEQNKLNNEDLEDLKASLNDISNYFSSLLSVYHQDVDVNIEMLKEECQIDIISDDILSSFYTHDIIIFPIINEEMEENVLAQAWTCLVLSNNKPVAGVVEINKDFSLNKLDSYYYSNYLLMHEISHILGFNTFTFKAFNLSYSKTVDGITKHYINSTKVLQKAKLHFNCENIKGIELENQGGDGSVGSHWEARYMLGDYMISTDYPEVVISDITLALFEDTGLYKVNYYTGGLFRFGKNKGCPFLNEPCVYNNGKNTLFPNEFCTEPEAYFCGSSHILRGECFIVDYEEIIEKRFSYYSNRYIGGFEAADFCPVSYTYYDEELEKSYNYHYNCKYGHNIFKELGEVIGKSSLCFESSLLPTSNPEDLDEMYSICYEVECDRDKKQIKVLIGNSYVICPKKGTILNNPNGFKGQIKCPDYNIICTSKIWCNELFDCISKKSEADQKTYDYGNFFIENEDIYDEYENNDNNVNIGNFLTIKLSIILLSLLF